MESQMKHLITDLAVGILGLFVGIDNLIRWMNNESLIHGLIIGIICLIFAAPWLVYVFARRRKSI